MIGRKLSHYRVIESLGQGGMGTVYRAEDTLLGRAVALKFPHRELIHDREARERFLREARAASALDHPNIVVLYDVCEAEGETFIAMQCVEGHSLRERLDAGPIPAPEAISIGRAVADALAHAHARGVIHRDIKPENILICDDGRVKVADFGTARMIEDSRVTRSGVMVGTLAYLPPEAVAGAPADARSDLYSLGVTLYEMCAGEPPFKGEPAALLYQIAHGTPPALPSHVPAGLRRLIESLLSRFPDDRPARAIDAADALERTVSAAAGASAGGSAERGAEPPARSIAVLEFANLTGDPEDSYFCAGITEDVSTDLMKIPDLTVASRQMVSSLAGRTADVRETGRALGVATLLKGGVRRAGGRVRVTAELVRTDTGHAMWAERYDRKLEDIFEVQDDLSRQIAAAMRLAFQPEDADAKLGRRTRSTRAYDLRLQALALYHRMDDAEMRRAIALLEEAIREDPDYALAHAELAECCIQMVCKSWDFDPQWLSRAGVESRRALELAPSLPEGFRASGHLFMHRGLPRDGLRDFSRAVELDPHFADALLKVGNGHLFLGDSSRAEVFARRAVGLGPHDPRYHMFLGEILLRQRRIGEARAAGRRALDLGSGRYMRRAVYSHLMLGYAWENDLDGVRRVADEAGASLGEEDVFVLGLRAQAAAFAGSIDEARRLLAGPALRSGQENDLKILLARCHMLLGDPDAAIRTLESAVEIIDLDELRTDPQLSALSGDPRFDRLLQRYDAGPA
ncbi:MAG TPA: protein kinase [Candidatus Udaeobacter sp.]|jgi:non-specific serine/threonine protein kinase|nr:protein kinase [Candidatus Udaeobacter sp.]